MKSICRSKVIQKSKADVFKYVSDFAHFRQTDPWSLCEPTRKSSTSERTHGVGAWYEWSGKIIGSGRMEIIEIFPDNGGVKFKLDFFEPKGEGNTHMWLLEEVEENGNIACKVSNIFYPRFLWFLLPFKSILMKMMDKMLGGPFELELLRLAHLVDKNEPPVDIILQDSEQLGDMYYIAMKFSDVTVNMKNVGKSCNESYPKIQTILSQHDITPQGYFVGYINFNTKTRKSDLLAGMFVDKNAYDSINNNDATIVLDSIPAHYYLKYEHRGAYETLHYAWDTVMFRANKMQDKTCKSLPHLEIYKEMPDKTGVAVNELLAPIVKELEEKVL